MTVFFATPTAEPAFALAALTPDAPAPALTEVAIDGQLDGLMLTLVLRQTYVHRGSGPIEVQYTFPVPHGAVLLDVAARIGERRLQAQVLPRRQAETRYEEALDAGDAPVLLEQAGPGLYTANLGNLLPGETVVLEITQARLLGLEQGRLRVATPTTVAPRYGLPQQSGLQPHQVPEASLLVSYPLALRLVVGPALGRCTVVCATHAHRLETQAQGAVLTLEPGAMLDRDVVIEVRPAEPQPHWLGVTPDEASQDAPQVALASFTLPAQAGSQDLRLRLLLDCSGSMAGSSVASTRRAVRALLRGLTPADEVSMTCFGSRWEHRLAPAACTPEHLDRAREVLRAVDADLGGTEMGEALQAVFAMGAQDANAVLARSGTTGGQGVDVLLITDGQVWNSPALLAAARSGGHRVFAIGVGAAPVEGALRELAEATGGACEFVTPGEALREAVERMLARMREPSLGALAVHWGGAAPRWTLPLTRSAGSGDSVLALAGFEAGQAPTGPVRLMAQHEGALRELAATEAVAPAPVSLPRLAAALRLPLLDDESAESLAVAQRLVSPHTHAVLVHERAEGARSDQAATLQRVPQMLAAAWGGVGAVRAPAGRGSQVIGDLDPAELVVPCVRQIATPSVWRSVRSRSAAEADATPRFSLGMSDGASAQTPQLPAFLRAGQDPEVEQAAVLRRAVGEVRRWVQQGQPLQRLERQAAGWPDEDKVQALVMGMRGLGASAGQAWLLLALWTAEQQEDQATVQALRDHFTPHAAALLDSALTWLDDLLDATPVARNVRANVGEKILARN